MVLLRLKFYCISNIFTFLLLLTAFLGLTSLATVSKRWAAINGLAPAAAAMFINGGEDCECGGETAAVFNEEDEDDEEETRLG